MSELKPCPSCGAKNTPECTLITELYDHDKYKYGKCFNCGIKMYDWNTRPEEDALRARIMELEKSQVVWHKYPEEKPEPSYEYEVNIPVMIYSMNGCTYFADYNIDSGNFWRYGGKENNVSHWAYLPEAPKGEK